MLKRLKRYFNPRSLTWWVSTVVIFSGVNQIYGFEIPGVTPIVRPIIDAVYGAGNPGELISAGLAGWGIGGKLDAMKDDLLGDTSLRPEFEDIDEDPV